MALLHQSSAETLWNRTDIISGDTNGLQTSEVRHAVDDADANGDLGRLRGGVINRMADLARLQSVRIA
ncbi:MAG: hypothetical protein E5299_01417 [Burkholderia gladioli]|nr:MAG: hypothetical protein E5299_01417 [Burkholderia gladioli]